jgi:uncharacterized protein YbjT (DUF2867 family)
MEDVMILITGASGNVGREVLKQIAESGAKVRAAFQSREKAAGAPKSVDVAVVDFNQPGTLRVALKDVERVFLVGPPTEQLPALEGKAMDVIKQTGVRQVVKLSSIGGESTFPRLHAKSEEYVVSTGVPYTFLRANGFMQNVVNFNTQTINSQNAFYGCQGDGPVSVIDIRDIAAVAVKALTEDGHVGKGYTLTGPEALSNGDIARILSEALGREIKYVDLPEEQFRQALMSAGVPQSSADALIDLQRWYRGGKAAIVTRDVEQVTGRKPINFAQFVHDYKTAFDVREKVAS